MHSSESNKMSIKGKITTICSEAGERDQLSQANKQKIILLTNITYYKPLSLNSVS